MKGLIALDIDGTITADKSHLPNEVSQYFQSLASQDWKFIFLTGRSLQWAQQTLDSLTMPYTVAVQNGAALLEMPSRKLLVKRYLDKTFLPILDLCCKGEPTDYVIFSGYDNQDICYCRPKRFEPKLYEYVKERGKLLKETWVETDSFETLAIEEFASVKCYGERGSLERIGTQIEIHSNLHAPLVVDPIHEGYYILQASHPLVSKGEVLKWYHQQLNPDLIIIAAGDEDNDRTMLQEADVKIVMATANKELLNIADVIAPPATEKGIISGLQQAIDKYI
jgi:hydroxymethylpyrimidine pyrophosphatase-like HAD family hydrolase